MSENLLESGHFQRASASTKDQIRSGTIAPNGGSATVATLEIPIAGWYLIQATGWNYNTSNKRFTDGHIALTYSTSTVISQQGLDDFTFNIMGYAKLSKGEIIKLIYTNWDTVTINLSSSAMANFNFRAIRIG